MYLKVAEALRTAGKMTDSMLKRFIFVETPNGMSGKQLIPISSPQIQILLVQRPVGTYNQQQASSSQAASSREAAGNQQASSKQAAGKQQQATRQAAGKQHASKQASKQAADKQQQASRAGKQQQSVYGP